MFCWTKIIGLIVMSVGLEARLELNLSDTEPVCINELFSLVDNPADSLCEEYSLCLVYIHKLHLRDLSLVDLGDIEEPYQEELVRLGVGCVLGFSVVIERLRVPIITSSTVAPTTTIKITTSATTKIPETTVTESTTVPSSSPTKKSPSMSSTVTSSSSTMITVSPSTSTTNFTTAAATTPKYVSKSTTTVASTATQKPKTDARTSTLTLKVTSSPKLTASSTTRTGSGIPDCIKDINNGCDRRPNGDYPTCVPVCKKGVYITCTNGRTILRECQLGWYTNPQRERFLARTMFHPSTKRCEYKTAYCPRQLDNDV